MEPGFDVPAMRVSPASQHGTSMIPAGVAACRTMPMYTNSIGSDRCACAAPAAASRARLASARQAARHGRRACEGQRERNPCRRGGGPGRAPDRVDRQGVRTAAPLLERARGRQRHSSAQLRREAVREARRPTRIFSVRGIGYRMANPREAWMAGPSRAARKRGPAEVAVSPKTATRAGLAKRFAAGWLGARGSHSRCRGPRSRSKLTTSSNSSIASSCAPRSALTWQQNRPRISRLRHLCNALARRRDDSATLRNCGRPIR